MMALMTPTRTEDVTAQMAPTDVAIVQHPLHAMIAPISAPPPDMPLEQEQPLQTMALPEQSVASPPPDMPLEQEQPLQTMALPEQSVASPQPATPKQMSAVQRYEDRLAQKQMSDFDKDENPYGSANNHPGFFGKVLHGLSVATGGPNRRLMSEAKRNAQIEGIEQEQGAQASQRANTAHLNAETPEIAPNAESERELHTAEAGNLDSETTERAQAAAQGPSLANAYAHAVNQAITAGRDPAQDPIVRHLSDAITALQPQQNKTQEAPKTIQVQVGGKPHQMAWNPQSSKYDLDQGESGEKPPTIKVGSGDAELDRTGSRFGKPYESAVSSANTQLDKIADARAYVNGNAEAQAVGVPKVLTALVSGQGSGIRITQAELNMIAHARGIQGDFEGWMNKVNGKGALTDEQKRQLSGVLDDAKQRIIVKQQIANDTLNRMNGAPTRQEIIQADQDARQKLSEYEQHGFYTGQRIPQGTVVGFSADGKVRIDDAR